MSEQMVLLEEALQWKATLRDQFAMAALTGLMSNGPVLTEDCKDWLVEACYGYADAMLKERAKVRE